LSASGDVDLNLSRAVRVYFSKVTRAFSRRTSLSCEFVSSGEGKRKDASRK
jgi:hypothetical protein